MFHTAVAIAHLIAAAVGVGSATVSDVLFTQFLRDYRISKFEEQALRALHPIMWTALGALILTGVMLVMENPERYLMSTKFQLKMIVVAVIIVNGIFLNIAISPRLRRISFGAAHVGHHERELVHLRRAAFVSGATSLSSWYAALILGALRSVTVPLTVGLGTYLALLAAAVAFALFLEATYRKSAERRMR